MSASFKAFKISTSLSFPLNFTTFSLKNSTPTPHKFSKVSLISTPIFSSAFKLFPNNTRYKVIAPHLIPISTLSYRTKPKPALTLMRHSSAKKQAISTSLPEVGVQPSLYSALPNLALVCDRGSKVSPISNVFVTGMLCDLHVNGSGSYAFLLYRLK